MNETAYLTFCNNVPHGDIPLEFRFTEEETEALGIEGDDTGYPGEKTVPLGENGLAWFKAALIFELLARETETLK